MAGITPRLAAIVAAAAVHVSTLTAAPALTRVEDRLYRADGSRFSGTLYIEWKSFEAADRSAIPSSAITSRVSDGVLRVQLAPTTNSSPRGWYRVQYSANGKTDFVEYWSVPPSTTPLRVRDIRIPGPLAATSSDPVPPINTAILITDIAGLRDELDHRAAKGDGYVPGRVAIVNSEGDLESASGNSTDCVHVDGSSGPCGGSEVAFVDAETPGGVVDGSNAAFILANPPIPAASVALYRNGLLLRAGVDYTLSGSIITMVSGAEPQPGDVFQVWYRTLGPSAGPASFADAETPSGSVDGVNGTFQLAAAPAPATSLQLFRNGMLLKAGVDYDLTGDVVQFRNGAVPQPGDTLAASYRY